MDRQAEYFAATVVAPNHLQIRSHATNRKSERRTRSVPKRFAIKSARLPELRKLKSGCIDLGSGLILIELLWAARCAERPKDDHRQET